MTFLDRLFDAAAPAHTAATAAQIAATAAKPALVDDGSAEFATGRTEAAS